MRRALFTILTALLVSMGARSVNADTVTISTGAGATSGGQQVAAGVVITTGAGTVTVDLSNLLTAGQVISAGQNLSALSFTLDNTASSGSVASSAGTFISVGSGGAVTAASSSLSGANLIGWLLSNSGNNYQLNGLNALASPAQTIIGGTAGSFSAYSSANPSIDGPNPHNPFVQGSGEFVLDISGVTAATKISNISFSFGTSAGNNVPVPEPSGFLLLLTGLTGFAGVARRKFQR
jgi:hypothetical protein